MKVLKRLLVAPPLGTLAITALAILMIKWLFKGSDLSGATPFDNLLTNLIAWAEK